MRTNNLNGVFDRMLALTRVLDEVAGDARRDNLSEGPARSQLWLPPVDIYETETAFIIEADLPGVHQENVSIQFERNALTISGARAPTLPAKERAQLRVYSAERLTGAFSRSIRLPEHVDGERIEATYVNGVLIITVPKSAGAVPRKIAIGSQETQRSIKG